MSFVLVLAAAVTLVVGLLQSGLTLIYLSIGCSVLAGVVLAVAVLRGRPEPRPAAAPRAFTPPPARTEQVPASVGAPSTPAAAQPTTSWSAPTPAPPPPPPPPSTPAPSPAASRPASDETTDEATRAAGTALLGRLRGRRSQQDEAAAEPVAVPAPAADIEDDEEFEAEPAGAYQTAEMAAVSVSEDDDGFPVADYDRLRATELLARLPDLDRNQLEAVRDREAAGKNRFTIMSRIDALLAAQEEPAWDVADDEWEAGTDAESEAVVIEAQAIEEDEDFAAALDEEEEFAAAGSVEDDEVDELVSPAAGFPIAGYESLTVGQILPRLSDLDADALAQVRAREQQGRARGTILDRIDRLAAKSGTGAGAMAMPPAAPPARKAPARATKAPARATKAPARATKATKALKADSAPAKRRARTPVLAPETAPVPAPAATPVPKKASARKSSSVGKGTVIRPAAPKKAAATKAASAKKTPAKKAAPIVPAQTPARKARAPRAKKQP